MSSMPRHFLYNFYDIVAPKIMAGLSFALVMSMLAEGWLW